MQYKVPQKIDLEDKIIGPLTLKQFIYLLGGGLIDYMILSATKSSFLGWMVIVLVSLLALAFAFVQIEEQPFSYLVTNFFTYTLRPKLRLWDKRGKVERAINFTNKQAEKPIGPAMKRPEEVKSSLEALSQVLDTHGWSPEQYKEELQRYGIQSDLEERIKSSTTAKKDLNLGRTEEAEVDLLHKA
ncbi:MAG: PrgI family protein [Candidatus Berkelbacteria bacterium]|nr:PrgI family protein [Candidatus Berkelbacteria bacterium]